MKIVQTIFANIKSAEKVKDGIVIEYMETKVPNPENPNPEPELVRTFLHKSQINDNIQIIDFDEKVTKLEVDKLDVAATLINDKITENDAK